MSHLQKVAVGGAWRLLKVFVDGVWRLARQCCCSELSIVIHTRNCATPEVYDSGPKIFLTDPAPPEFFSIAPSSTPGYYANIWAGMCFFVHPSDPPAPNTPPYTHNFYSGEYVENESCEACQVYVGFRKCCILEGDLAPIWWMKESDVQFLSALPEYALGFVLIKDEGPSEECLTQCNDPECYTTTPDQDSIIRGYGDTGFIGRNVNGCFGCTCWQAYYLRSPEPIRFRVTGGPYAGVYELNPDLVANASNPPGGILYEDTPYTINGNADAYAYANMGCGGCATTSANGRYYSYSVGLLGPFGSGINLAASLTVDVEAVNPTDVVGTMNIDIDSSGAVTLVELI